MPQLKSRTARRQRSSRGNAADVAATVFPTELGWMGVAFRGDTLLGLVFGHAAERNANVALRRAMGNASATIEMLDGNDCPATIRDVIEKLHAYAAGERVDFRGVAIDEGHLTAFARRVVAACRRIPAGQTRTYGQLAAVCGSPGAARAVGHVMATNRYPIVMPCHRVVGANGSLGGFSAPQGLAMKRRMLALEDAACR